MPYSDIHRSPLSTMREAQALLSSSSMFSAVECSTHRSSIIDPQTGAESGEGFPGSNLDFLGKPPLMAHTLDTPCAKAALKRHPMGHVRNL